MGTRAYIAKVETDTKQVDLIYCHSEGYPENMLPILNTYYLNEKAIDDLLFEGSISMLQRDPHSCFRNGFTQGEQYPQGQSMIMDWEDFAEFPKVDVEFLYLFYDGKWYYKSLDPYKCVSSTNPWDADVPLFTPREFALLTDMYQVESPSHLQLPIPISI